MVKTTEREIWGERHDICAFNTSIRNNNENIRFSHEKNLAKKRVRKAWAVPSNWVTATPFNATKRKSQHNTQTTKLSRSISPWMKTESKEMNFTYNFIKLWRPLKAFLGINIIWFAERSLEIKTKISAENNGCIKRENQGIKADRNLIKGTAALCLMEHWIHREPWPRLGYCLGLVVLVWPSEDSANARDRSNKNHGIETQMVNLWT